MTILGYTRFLYTKSGCLRLRYLTFEHHWVFRLPNALP